jgi:hypothetical protein
MKTQKEIIAAQDPTTPPEVLKAMSKKSYLAKHVATNPNTPTETILELADQYPEEVLNNSMFPIILFTDPLIAQRLELPTIEVLSRYPQCPKSIVKRFNNMTGKEFSKLLRSWEHTHVTIIDVNAQSVRLSVDEFGAYDIYLKVAAHASTSGVAEWKSVVRAAISDATIAKMTRNRTQEYKDDVAVGVQRIREVLDRLEAK